MLSALQGLPILTVTSNELHLRALALAARTGMRATYDAHYAALAHSNGAHLWTADKDLAKRAATASIEASYLG